MKLGNHFVGSVLLASFVICGSAIAATDDMSSTGATTSASAPTKTKHSTTTHTRTAARGSLARCVQENTAVAETFCQTHQDQCAAEKSGVRSECEAELRGERHSG
ncbi:MAG: hypothetical protein JWR16_1836 [Nevskia sp.]|nr:hypothetical protein [Nevskia sp.]